MIALPTFRGALAGFNPRSLSPALWLNDTGSDPSVWTDISGNGRNATQATGANQPSIVTGVLNGRQVRRFDGVNDVLIPPDFNLDNFTIFSVIYHNNTVSGSIQSIFAIGSIANSARDAMIYIFNSTTLRFDVQRSNGVLFPAAATPTTNLIFQITSGKFTGTQLVSYINNGTKNIVDTTVSGTTENKPTVGAYKHDGIIDGYFKGDIAELIVYPTSLSDANCLRVEKYLSNKYNIAIA